MLILLFFIIVVYIIDLLHFLQRLLLVGVLGSGFSPAAKNGSAGQLDEMRPRRSN